MTTRFVGKDTHAYIALNPLYAEKVSVDDVTSHQVPTCRMTIHSGSSFGRALGENVVWHDGKWPSHNFTNAMFMRNNETVILFRSSVGKLLVTRATLSLPCTDQPKYQFARPSP